MRLTINSTTGIVELSKADLRDGIMKRCLLGVAVVLVASQVHAKSIDCNLLGRDRLSIKLVGENVHVTHYEGVSSWRVTAVTTERKVLFHHYSDPVDLSKKFNLEPAHSLLVLQSMGTGGVEFAPDLITVNWGKSTVRYQSAYHEKAESRWVCLRKD